MSSADSFTFFRLLPLELRLQIWREALSVRSVWAAARNLASNGDPASVDHPLFSMAYIGPAPYLAGLSSKEARQLLEQTYGKPIRGPSAGVYWVDMDQTVVYLGDSLDAMGVIESFHADDLSRFKHVALAWSQFHRLARLCQRLATTCAALCTIVIHQVETDATAIVSGSLSQSLSLETAAYYATIPTHTRSELGYEKLDTDYLRSLLWNTLVLRLPGYICCRQTWPNLRTRPESWRWHLRPSGCLLSWSVLHRRHLIAP